MKPDNGSRKDLSSKLCLKESSKQINKLLFRINFQIYSLLSQTKGERKVFFGECEKQSRFVRLNQRGLGCYKR